jgi:hypothetical protein
LRAGAATGYVAAVVLLSLAVIVAVATAVDDARAAGLRHAQRISGRAAFAARVAFEMVGESARTELESLMAEWRRFPDSEVIETVERCYSDAGKQIEALRTNGKLDAARVGWGQIRPARSGFDGVRLRIFQALGGYDAEGPTEFTRPHHAGKGFVVWQPSASRPVGLSKPAPKGSHSWIWAARERRTAQMPYGRACGERHDVSPSDDLAV